MASYSRWRFVFEFTLKDCNILININANFTSSLKIPHYKFNQHNDYNWTGWLENQVCADFSLLYYVQTISGANLASYWMDTRVLGGKCAQHEADNSSPSS